MKTLIFAFILTFSLLYVTANPVIPHPLVITELHIDNNGHWVMEIKNGFAGSPESNLNNIRITTSTGSYYFKPGISLTYNQLFLINNDSLQTPLAINRSNDFIKIEKNYGNESWTEIGFPLSFGSSPTYCVGPIALNQSIELFVNTIVPSEFMNIYVKSAVPSLGVYPAPNLYNNSKGVFQGYVYDGNYQPYTNNIIRVYFTPYTDGYPSYISVNQQSGFFNKEIYSCKYHVSIIIYGFRHAQFDSIIDIEPGLTTNYVYHGILVKINSMLNSSPADISNYPNPVSDHTSFTFTLPDYAFFSKGIIKIYNINGEIVKILPVSSANIIDNKYCIPLNINNDNSFTSGTYYYCLEIDGQKMSNNKMTILK